MREITVVELEAFQRRDPIDVCLDIWARWCALSDFQVTSGNANEQDTKEFMRAGEAVEVMINALPRYQWWAIRKAKGICTAWIFKDSIYPEALQDAKLVLEPLMKKHIATRRYFN